MDTDRLKSTWKTVTLNGDDVALYFYAHLFVTHPELREMFPLAMDVLGPIACLDPDEVLLQGHRARDPNDVRIPAAAPACIIHPVITQVAIWT